MNGNHSKPRHWTRLVRLLSILILLSVCVSTLTAQKQWSTVPRPVLIRMVFEGRRSEIDDEDMGPPFELQFRHIPPDRMQFDKDGEAFRIIGNRYYVKSGPGTWLRVEKETFDEMTELSPIATLALKESASSPEDLIKVRDLREIPETGITIIGGQRCRQYESKVTLDKELPPVHLVSTVWLAVKNKLPIKIVSRVYEDDSTDPVATFTMTFDYKTKFRIPTPIL